MSEFLDCFTDKNFIGAYNAFSSGDIADRDKGIIYVEDASDSSFWETFINHIYPNQYVCRPSSLNGKIVTGKRFLEGIYSKANEKAIIAVDSDYDYIISKIQSDHIFNNNKYIIHTYGFSKESVQIEKNSMASFFRRCKLYIPNTIDVTSFLNDLSVTAFEGLARYIAIRCRKDCKDIYYNEFNSCFNLLEKIKIDRKLSIDKIFFEGLQKNVDLFFSDKLISIEELEEAKRVLHEIEINEDNAYRFISGHVLFNLIEKIHNLTLKQLKINEIESIIKKFDENEINNRISQTNKDFERLFNLYTFCHTRPVDSEDEIHRLILSSISNIK